jgi:hypothetical protein
MTAEENRTRAAAMRIVERMEISLWVGPNSSLDCLFHAADQLFVKVPAIA